MNKSIVAIAIAAILAPVLPATAAAPAGLETCGQITDSQARLQCFDRELAKSRPTAAAPASVAPAPKAAAAPAPAAPAAAAANTSAAASPNSATQNFGAESVPASSKTAPEEQKVMHARLSSQKEIGSSRTYNVFLDNGQVWRHENSDLGSYLREGDAVTISKGSLGSYRLTRDEGKNKDWIRVTRVR